MADNGRQFEDREREGRGTDVPLDLTYDGTPLVTAGSYDASEERIADAGLLEKALSLAVGPAYGAETEVSSASLTEIYGEIIDEQTRQEYLGKRAEWRTQMEREITSIEAEPRRVELIKEKISPEELAYMAEISKLYGIPKEVLVGIRMCETGPYANPELFSPTGAEGRFQIIAGTGLTAGNGRVIVRLTEADKERLPRRGQTMQIPVDFEGRQFTIGRYGEYVDETGVYPPEDERLGLRVWGMAASIIAKYKKGRSWADMAYYYNGDPAAQDAYREKFVKYMRAAKEVYKEDQGLPPRFAKIEIGRDTSMAELANSHGLTTLVRNTPVGAVNGHLGLLRIPLNQLPPLKIPEKYLFNYRASFLVDDGNAFGRQALGQTYSREDGYFEIDTTAFNPMDPFTWSYESQKPTYIGNGEHGLYLGYPQYPSGSRGKKFPPTLDDLARAGIPLEAIVTWNPELFGYGNSVTNDFKLETCDPAVLEYLVTTNIRSGSELYVVDGEVEIMDVDAKIAAIQDQVDYDLFALCMFEENDKDKKELIQAGQGRLEAIYRGRRQMHKVNKDPLWQVLQVMDSQGSWGWDYGNNEPLFAQHIDGGGKKEKVRKKVRKYLEQRADEKFPAFDVSLEEGSFSYEDVRWLFMLSEFWEKYPPADPNKRDKLLGYLSFITRKNKVDLMTAQSKKVQKVDGMYIPHMEWIDAQAGITDRLAAKNVREIYVYVDEWNTANQATGFEIVKFSMGNIAQVDLMMSVVGGYVFEVKCKGKKVGYVSLVRDGSGEFYVHHSVSDTPEKIAKKADFAGKYTPVTDKEWGFSARTSRLFFLAYYKKLADRRSGVDLDDGKVAHSFNPDTGLSGLTLISEPPEKKDDKKREGLRTFEVYAKEKKIAEFSIDGPNGRMVLTTGSMTRDVTYDQLVSELRGYSQKLELVNPPLKEKMDDIQEQLKGKPMTINTSYFEVTPQPDERYIFTVRHGGRPIGYVSLYEEGGRFHIHHSTDLTSEKIKDPSKRAKHKPATDAEIDKKLGRIFRTSYFKQLVDKGSKTEVDDVTTYRVLPTLTGIKNLDLIVTDSQYASMSFKVMKGEKEIGHLDIDGDKKEFRLTPTGKDIQQFTKFDKLVDALEKINV